jgi:acetyl esterase
MASWPKDFEPLREEARAMARRSTEHYRSRQAGLDVAGRVAMARTIVAGQEQDAPGGRDDVVADVACRLFDPAGDQRRGTYVHLHGGGLMAGSPRMDDLRNDELAARLGVRIVSVDYRLAPEHPYPAGADDCLAVAGWAIDHEAGPVVLGGESAGASLAAHTLLRVRDRLGAIARIAAANLTYGTYDLGGTPSNRGARATDLDDLLEDDRATFVRGVYLPGCSAEEARDPSISPLYADLRGLPRALFTVGHADRLLDDSLFLAARWEAAGNHADVAVYPDCVHGFVSQPTELARRARARIEQFLDAAFDAPD